MFNYDLYIFFFFSDEKRRKTFENDKKSILNGFWQTGTQSLAKINHIWGGNVPRNQ